MKKKVLFVCTHNSARSQMAEALMNALFGDRYEAYSTGTAPSGVNRFAVKAMAEAGIDISKHYSKSVDDLSGIDFDYIVTVCDNAKENCPYVSGGGKRLHKSFEDPSTIKGGDDETLQGFIRIRDEIKKWLEAAFA